MMEALSGEFQYEQKANEMLPHPMRSLSSVWALNFFITGHGGKFWKASAYPSGVAQGKPCVPCEQSSTRSAAVTLRILACCAMHVCSKATSLPLAQPRLRAARVFVIRSEANTRPDSCDA